MFQLPHYRDTTQYLFRINIPALSEEHRSEYAAVDTKAAPASPRIIRVKVPALDMALHTPYLEIQEPDAIPEVQDQREDHEMLENDGEYNRNRRKHDDDGDRKYRGCRQLAGAGEGEVMTKAQARFASFVQ